MVKTPTEFVDRRRRIKKIYVSISLVFCIIILCAYIFAWSRGASFQSILVSGATLLTITFLFCGGGYFFSVRLAKRDLEKISMLDERKVWDVYRFVLLFAMLACDVFGVFIILVKKMFLAGAIVITLGSLVFYFSSKKNSPRKRKDAEGGDTSITK